jgi:hypothetical protein
VPCMDRDATLLAHGLAGGVGLLVMGWATQAALWTGYMRANPAVGTVSSSGGGAVVVAVLFVLGATLAYTAFARGLRWGR